MVLSSATAVSPTFTSPASSTVGLTLTVNNGFVSSIATLVTVAVNTAGPDTVVISVAASPLGKQRLTVTAASSITDGTPILTLVGFGPNGTGIQMPFAGGGLYTVILTGVPSRAQSPSTRASEGRRCLPSRRSASKGPRPVDRCLLS
jgi:hypothetical protein